MAEETQTQQDGQKTLVAFVVGLLIGGMLVWAFSGPTADAPAENTDNGSDSSETATSSDEESETNDDSATNEESTDESEDANASSESTNDTQLPVGDGSVTIQDQPASSAVAIESATYPVSEGWIGVREYNDGQLGTILGVVRFSESQELLPEQIVLQRPTVAGQEYAVVIFTEDGDFDFNLAGDVQIDEIFDTFTAQ